MHESNHFGCFGVRTAVTYYLEFMTKTSEHTVSKQRKMQLKIDGPLQYFTNTGIYKKDTYSTMKREISNEFPLEFAEAGITDLVKMHLSVISKNKV